MRRHRSFTALLGAITVLSAVAAATETSLPERLAGFRSWGKLTKEPQIVPYQLAYRCAILPPKVEDLERHGPHTHHWIMVYANPLADAALRNDAAKHFPPGAIIAKEKRAAPGGAQSDGIAFMVKHVPGEFHLKWRLGVPLLRTTYSDDMANRTPMEPQNNRMPLTAPVGRAGNGVEDATASRSPFGKRRRRSSSAVFDGPTGCGR